MSTTYEQVPVRLQLSIVSTPPVAPIDANTGFAPQMWRAQSLAIDVGIFSPSGPSIDLSNLQYLQLLIQETQSSIVAVVNKVVYANSIIPTIPVDQWNAGEAQQATIILSNADTDLTLSGDTQQTYWLVLLGKTNAGATIIYGAGPITLLNPSYVLPAPIPQGLVSAHESTSVSGDLTVTPESQLHIEEITVSGAAGLRNIIVLADGLIAGARVSLRFILPATDAIDLVVRDQAVGGTVLTTISSNADGFTPASRVELWFDGTNLKRDFLVQPAFGQQS